MGLIDPNIKIDGTIIKDTLTGIGDFFQSIRSAITGKLPPKEEAELMLKLDEGSRLLVNAQIEVNKVEAANPNVFVSGWRPAVGWVAAAALGCYYIPQTLMATILWSVQCIAVMSAAADITAIALPAYPNTFDVGEILGLVGSLLGIGTMRSVEKIKGVSRS